MGNEGQVQRPWWQQPAWWLLGGVTVFNLAYLFLTPFDLFPDEAQYWDWSRHLQWSYYSKGPLIAWLIALFTRFTGPTPWGVRLGAVLLTAVVAFFVSRLVLLESRSPASGQSQPALLTTFSLLLLNPLFSVGQVLMTTDVPFIACWTAALYALARVLQEEGADWWIIGAGVALGLGFLAKYSMLLLLLPLLFTLVQERRLTLWLRRPSTYGAALVALLLAAPVLIWNAQHDWPTVRHVARLAGQGRGWRFFVPEFLTAQILLLTPFVFLYLTRVSLRAVRAEASAAEKLLGWSFLALFGFFLLKAAQSKVEQNWPAMAYVGAMVLAGRAWARGEGTRPGRRRWAVVSLVLMVGLSLLARSFPLLHHLFPSERLVRIDPTRRGVGYRELGQAVGAWRERLARQTGQQPEDIFPFAAEYQITSELAFYVPGQPTTYCANAGRRRNQYDYWPGFENLLGRDGLFVQRGNPSAPPAAIAAGFACWERLALVPIRRGHNLLHQYTLFFLRDFRGFPPPEGEMSY